MSHNWGYSTGKKMMKELSGAGKVSVKPHFRGARGPNNPAAGKKVAAPPIAAPEPKIGPAIGMKCGGGVKKMAKGGAVHSDAAQDRKMVKGMVDKSCLKAKGGAIKFKKKGC